MHRLQSATAAVLLVANLCAAPRDARRTYDLIKTGSTLPADTAAKLEQSPDEDARIQLLAYYTAHPGGMELAAAKAARLKHILWVIENDPKQGLGLFPIGTGVHRLHCQGDDLADRDGFEKIVSAWLEQLRKHGGDADVRRNAVEAIRFCAPEKAEAILVEANDQPALGRLYAAAVLGITGQAYWNNDPVGSDAALRALPFAAKARRILDESKDRGLLVAGAVTLLRDGATLWGDGNLDWDYTPYGNAVLARAKAADPESLTLPALPTALPARGERPPTTLRVGGNVQAAQLIRKVRPVYPATAKRARVQGVVRMGALIGPDGTVVQLRAESGPPELVPASMEAARQWQYKPTLLNGRPCYVITVIEINYEISR